MTDQTTTDTLAPEAVYLAELAKWLRTRARLHRDRATRALARANEKASNGWWEDLPGYAEEAGFYGSSSVQLDTAASALERDDQDHAEIVRIFSRWYRQEARRMISIAADARLSLHYRAVAQLLDEIQDWEPSAMDAAVDALDANHPDTLKRGLLAESRANLEAARRKMAESATRRDRARSDAKKQEAENDLRQASDAVRFFQENCLVVLAARTAEVVAALGGERIC